MIYDAWIEKLRVRPPRLPHAVAGLVPSTRDFALAVQSPGRAELGAVVHLFEDDPLEGRGEASASDWPALVARIDEGDAVALCVTPPADLGAAGAALRASELPALWNEPVLSESQIVEARAAGADAVLLVCALHEPDALAALARAARGYHMAAAFVVHDEEDLARAAAAQAALLVLDARDKATGAADADRIVRLAALSPRRTVLVARGAGDSRALRGKVDSLIVRYT